MRRPARVQLGAVRFVAGACRLLHLPVLPEAWWESAVLRPAGYPRAVLACRLAGAGVAACLLRQAAEAAFASSVRPMAAERQ